VSPRLESLLREYEQSHRHPVNRAIHKVCVPLILFHVLAMLDWVELARIDALGGRGLTLGHLTLIATLGWYLSLDRFLALLVGTFSLACLVAAVWVPVWAVCAIAVVAWALQLWGHSHWERSRPAFAREPVQLLVGPLFVFALLSGRWDQTAPGS